MKRRAFIRRHRFTVTAIGAGSKPAASYAYTMPKARDGDMTVPAARRARYAAAMAKTKVAPVVELKFLATVGRVQSQHGDQATGIAQMLKAADEGPAALLRPIVLTLIAEHGCTPGTSCRPRYAHSAPCRTLAARRGKSRSAAKRQRPQNGERAIC